MLKFFCLTAALSAAFIPFLPKVALSVPLAVDANGPTVITYPSTGSNTVITNSTDGFTTRVGYPTNGYGTTTVYPNNQIQQGYPTNGYGTTVYPNNRTRVGYPINNYGTVIINPSNVNPSRRQPNCGSVRMGNPIPSPVPVNPYTGRFC